MIRPEDIDALQAALDAEKGARTALAYAMQVRGDASQHPAFAQALEEAKDGVARAARAFLGKYPSAGL